MRAQYPDDLKDEEWGLIETILKETKASAHRRKPIYSKRKGLNAILYVLRTGFSWRNFPDDFPLYKINFKAFH